MALTKASFSMITGAYFNVLDFGADSTGATDSTAAFQAAIEAAQLSARPVYIPAGFYLITDTLNVYNGTQITGDTNFSYGQGFGRQVYATTITFTPATAKPLFDYSWKTAPSPGPVFHTSLENLFLTATDPTKATFGLKLQNVIFANYKNLTFENFDVGIYCRNTINNRFENCFISDAANVCVYYVGEAETTDVWEQCTFFGSPVGVRFNGPAVGVRFDNCLWEQIVSYGMDISSRCQSIMVTNAYCEDVPYGASPPADGCMFRVGQVSGDSAADIQNHLLVIGGQFNGRNAGIAGAGLFSVNFCWGIYAGGFAANRWPYIINTDATNTNPNSIVLGGYQGIGWSNNIDDLTKVCGIYPNGVLNTGSFSEVSKFSTVTATSQIVVSGTGGYVNFGDRIWVVNGGSPEGLVTAFIGSLYSRTDGNTSTSLYVKEFGDGNTGWVGK